MEEIISRGGEKISPSEVDDVIANHSAVAEVATFAIPHPTPGEAIAAAIVLRKHQSATEKESVNLQPSDWLILKYRGR